MRELMALDRDESAVRGGRQVIFLGKASLTLPDPENSAAGRRQ
jgi:hypothetical protein